MPANPTDDEDDDVPRQSLFDDRDVRGIPIDQFVPQHWLEITEVMRLAHEDVAGQRAITDELLANTPMPRTETARLPPMRPPTPAPT